jgi:hypothetical protein
LNIKRASTVVTSGAFHLQNCPESTKTIASLSTDSLDAARVLAYALIKEYARPYETLRERAAVRDFLPRVLTVIAMEKPSKAAYSRSHTTLEEAMEGVFPDRKSCSRHPYFVLVVLDCVHGLLLLKPVVAVAIGNIGMAKSQVS